MATPLTLEGDGLIENLFYFLWCKDDFGAGPRIYIPHTVLYKFTQPSAWYFTSLKTGKIKKKSKVNLNNIQIEHEFTKKKSATDIIAYYIYLPSGGESQLDVGDKGGGTSAMIEYFNSEGLREFLYKREKVHNGVLQKFVLPKGTCNGTIRAIWSPKICLLERRMNLKNVYDKRYTVYERGVTFDGADMHSRTEPVRGAILPGEVQLLCEQIVDHVTQVSYHKYRISRMVLHLKSDAEDRLWLLWCSSLRLTHVNAAEANAVIRPLDIVGDAHVPGFVNFGHVLPFVMGKEDEHRAGFARCTSCGLLFEHNKLLSTTYKAILEHFQRFMRFLRLRVNEQEHAAIEWPPDERLVQAAGGVGFGILQHMDKSSYTNSPGKKNNNGGSHASLTQKELIIPPVIQYLHPNFTVEDFERHRHDPIFLHKRVAVCESCCLVYSDYTTTALEVNSIRQHGPAILLPPCEVTELKKRLDPLDPLTITISSSSPKVSLSSTKQKPPASAWKPIPAPSSTMKTSVSKKSAINMLSNMPSTPQLPERIESFEELKSAAFSLENGSVGLSVSRSTNALQQREETFFRELYQEKNLKKGHPLHHMVESAARLSAKISKNQQLESLALGKSQSMGVLPSTSAPTTSKANGKSPYSMIQRLNDERRPVHNENHYNGDIEGKHKSPVKSKRRNQPKNLTSTKEGDNAKTSASKYKIKQNTAVQFISTRERKAAEEHQDFLFAALSEAQAQLEHIETLASVLPEMETKPIDETLSADNAQNIESEEGDEDDEDENNRGPDSSETPSACEEDNAMISAIQVSLDVARAVEVPLPLSEENQMNPN